MARARNSFAAVLLWLAAATCLAQEAPLADAAQEQQAQALFQALKCVVCEGQSLADSNALYAAQMRGHIRRMLEDGDSPAAIRDYFVERYGDAILMQPPLVPRTILLWGAPLLFLAGGLLLLLRFSRDGRGTKHG